MILGPDGKPFDARSEQQKEFDRQFRAQMGDNGGQFFERRFIGAIQREFDRRPDYTPPKSGLTLDEAFKDRE